MVIDKSVKNKTFFVISFFSVFLLLTGCGKNVCSYCGEEKYCNKYDILDTTRYICDDCLGDPNQSISGNVIMSYASELVDESLYRNAGIVSENYTGILGLSDNTYNNNQTSIATTDYSDMSVPSEITSDYTINDSVENNSTDADNTSQEASNDISSVLAASLSPIGYYISPTAESASVYELYYGNEKSNVIINLTNSSKVTVQKNKNAYDDDFDIACIYTTLAFLNSNDYENDGYNIYTQAKSIGNYSYSGANFYYTEGSEAEIADGGSLVTYQLTKQ